MPSAFPLLSYTPPLLLTHSPRARSFRYHLPDLPADFVVPEAHGGTKWLVIDEAWELFGALGGLPISFGGGRRFRVPDYDQTWHLLVYGQDSRVQNFLESVCLGGDLDVALGFCAKSAFELVDEHADALVLRWTGTLAQRDEVLATLKQKDEELRFSFGAAAC